MFNLIKIFSILILLKLKNDFNHKLYLVFFSHIMPKLVLDEIFCHNLLILTNLIDVFPKPISLNHLHLFQLNGFIHIIHFLFLYFQIITMILEF